MTKGWLRLWSVWEYACAQIVEGMQLTDVVIFIDENSMSLQEHAAAAKETMFTGKSPQRMPRGCRLLVH
jgi:transketolase N-terminal domain/subunit